MPDATAVAVFNVDAPATTAPTTFEAAADCAVAADVADDEPTADVGNC